mgnify:CR=1 FL=1
MDYNEPIFWVHLNMDYPFKLKGILYFPKVRNKVELERGKVKLYCNQVFIAVNLSATFLVICLLIFCTCLSFCKKLRETFNGISGQSITPFSFTLKILRSARAKIIKLSIRIPLWIIMFHQEILFLLRKYAKLFLFRA